MESGPFSYLTYLEHILKHDSWGDEIRLVVLSMVFQLRITIVTIPSLHGDPICHLNTLEKSDIVLLCSGGNHYLSVPVVYHFGFVSVVFLARICYECTYVVLVVFQSNKPRVRTVTVVWCHAVFLLR